MEHTTLGYAKTTKKTRRGLIIGANRNNSMTDMPYAQAHNATKRISIALDRSNRTDHMLHKLSPIQNQVQNTERTSRVI